MKIVCLDAKTLGKDADFSEIEKLGELEIFDLTPQNEIVSRLKNADIVITNKAVLTKEIIENLNLKLICVSATGVNNIDLLTAKKLQIPVKNVANYSTNSVAQQTFASLFNITNNVSYYKDYVSSKKWCNSETFTHLDRPIFELTNKEFGIIGLGDIGKKVAHIAQNFGANVRYYSTSGKNSCKDFIRVELDSLLKTSDIISIHAPLNENTRNLISKKEIEKLKNGAILMNFGRGGIVDEEELAKAVDSKNLKVVLDVLQTEPMIENHPLLNVKNKENVLITPHIAWASKEARQTLMHSVANNIKDFLNGK